MNYYNLCKYGNGALLPRIWPAAAAHRLSIADHPLEAKHELFPQFLLDTNIRLRCIHFSLFGYRILRRRSSDGCVGCLECRRQIGIPQSAREGELVIFLWAGSQRLDEWRDPSLVHPLVIYVSARTDLRAIVSTKERSRTSRRRRRPRRADASAHHYKHARTSPRALTRLNSKYAWRSRPKKAEQKRTTTTGLQINSQLWDRNIRDFQQMASHEFCYIL